MKQSVWILGDQLLENHPAFTHKPAQKLGQPRRVLLVESRALLQRRRHHRKKLVLLLSAMRHYAQELRQRGFEVDYRQADTMVQGIAAHVRQHEVEGVITMAANSWGGRRFQQRLGDRIDLPVTVLANTQFIANRIDYSPSVADGKRLTQESFYRAMRQQLGLLLTEAGEPIGGQWNYDHQNREPLPANLSPPLPIRFQPDAITRQVLAQVQGMANGHGSLEGFDLAVNRQQAKQAANDFFDARLPNFGTYEDAMSAQESLLYHSKLSPYLNLGLLDPLQLAQEAEKRFQQGSAPLNSVEGFIRQLIGWREYINWQYWRTMPNIMNENYFNASRKLPEFFWTGRTDMNCLQHALKRTLEQGYNHHIERLMLLSNYCLLTGVQPEQVLDWFMASYIDAYEWVMVPNVLGMGLYADGGLTSTKPYAASANYINKMSDYCQDCRYYRSKRVGENACPFNSLYWFFMLEHETRLKQNPRMGTSLLGLRHFDQQERDKIRQKAQQHITNTATNGDDHQH